MQQLGQVLYHNGKITGKDAVYGDYIEMVAICERRLSFEFSTTV
jgi:hypothetical protein